MIVLGMILLTEAGQQTDQRKGRFMAIIGLILVAIFFSVILSVFRSKAQGYPYRYVIFYRFLINEHSKYLTNSTEWKINPFLFYFSFLFK